VLIGDLCSLFVFSLISKLSNWKENLSVILHMYPLKGCSWRLIKELSALTGQAAGVTQEKWYTQSAAF
jgi:hypothetical protein